MKRTPCYYTTEQKAHACRIQSFFFHIENWSGAILKGRHDFYFILFTNLQSTLQQLVASEEPYIAYLPSFCILSLRESDTQEDQLILQI